MPPLLRHGKPGVDRNLPADCIYWDIDGDDNQLVRASWLEYEFSPPDINKPKSRSVIFMTSCKFSVMVVESTQNHFQGNTSYLIRLHRLLARWPEPGTSCTCWFSPFFLFLGLSAGTETRWMKSWQKRMPWQRVSRRNGRGGGM